MGRLIVMRMNTGAIHRERSLRCDQRLFLGFLPIQTIHEETCTKS